MQIKLTNFLLILSLCLVVHTAQAGDVIFQASFEESEFCPTFTGFNDDIDVTRVQLSGDLLLNGEIFPQSQYDRGQFSLRDRVTGDIFPIAFTSQLDYTANVVAGHYDLMYSVTNGGDQVPRNVGAVVMENIALLSDRVLDINLTAYMISGRYLLNGGAFPASQYDHGNFLLDGVMTGQVLVGDSKLRTFSDVPVLPGQYEVRYQSIQVDQTPANEFGLVGQIEVSADDSLAFEVNTVSLTGILTHNNSPWPVSEYDDGNFYLETASGDRVSLGNSHFNSYTQNVMTGNYDVFWELEHKGDTVPFNLRARVGSNASVDSGELDINVSSYQVAGSFSLDGFAFPGSVYQTGRIKLRDKVAGVDNDLGLTKDQSYQQIIIKGAYDFVYDHAQGEDVPQNQNATLTESVIIESADNRDVDVSSGFFSADVYHNGQLFPASQYQQGNILLRNTKTDDVVFLGKSAGQHLSARVVVGTYDAYYSHLNGDQVPQNQMALIEENLTVFKPPTLLSQSDMLLAAVELNVLSINVAGDFSMNGGPFPQSQYDDGLISLHWGEDSVLLGNTHDLNYQTRVISQRYWVHYGVQSPGETTPVNNDARISCAKVSPPLF